MKRATLAIATSHNAPRKPYGDGRSWRQVQTPERLYLEINICSHAYKHCRVDWPYSLRHSSWSLRAEGRVLLRLEREDHIQQDTAFRVVLRISMRLWFFMMDALVTGVPHGASLRSGRGRPADRRSKPFGTTQRRDRHQPPSCFRSRYPPAASLLGSPWVEHRVRHMSGLEPSPLGVLG